MEYDPGNHAGTSFHRRLRGVGDNSMIKCARCKKEFFTTRKTQKFCSKKCCASAHHKKWRAENKEHIRIYARAYRAANPEYREPERKRYLKIRLLAAAMIKIMEGENVTPHIRRPRRGKKGSNDRPDRLFAANSQRKSETVTRSNAKSVRRSGKKRA
jgi:endogenous inhibitor of DNA gyrase (YacG/DUF329 family)